MPTELSKILTDLQKEGAAVASSGRSNASRVAGLLDERWQKLPAPSPLDSGELPPRPDFLGVQLGLVQLVEHELQEAVVLDDSYVFELADDREKRLARELAAGEVSRKIVGIRNAVEGVYGQGSSLNLFGGKTQLPTDPVPLHRLGSRIRNRLRDEDFVLSEVRLEGWDHPDRERLAAGLDGPLDRLRQALAGLGVDRRDSERSLLDRTRAVEGCRRTLRQAAGCLAALYRLAGLDELAERIRPKRRAPRGQEVQNPDGGSPDGGNPDGGNPDGGNPDGGSPDGGNPDGGNPDGRSSDDRGSGDGPQAAAPQDEAATEQQTPLAEGEERNGPLDVVN